MILKEAINLKETAARGEGIILEDAIKIGQAATLGEEMTQIEAINLGEKKTAGEATATITREEAGPRRKAEGLGKATKDCKAVIQKATIHPKISLPLYGEYIMEQDRINIQ